jgi:hypothetical protein
MDLSKAIRELYEEKRRIDEVIASMEEYLRANEAPTVRRKRGRKSMGDAERQEVSERMRRYWQEQREKRTGPGQKE